MIALTPQQHRCVELMSAGLTDREIAEQIGAGVGTVKAHLMRLRDRTGARNRVELAIMYVRGVLVAPAEAQQ
jgi:DNA-binding CsgD family transcriptional regulator